MSTTKAKSPAKQSTNTPVGYSGKQLWQKLGFKAGMSVLIIDAPKSYPALLGEQSPDILLVEKVVGPVSAAHVFAQSQQALSKALSKLRKRLAQDGMVWVSWPKKSSGVDTEVDENTIRQLALPLGFVDVKVCAVDSTWSGLKLVIRKSER